MADGSLKQIYRFFKEKQDNMAINGRDIQDIISDMREAFLQIGEVNRDNLQLYYELIREFQHNMELINFNNRQIEEIEIAQHSPFFRPR